MQTYTHRNNQDPRVIFDYHTTFDAWRNNHLQ